MFSNRNFLILGSWLAVFGFETAFPVLAATNRITLPHGLTYFEGRGGSSVLRDAIRLQEVYGAELFPPHPIAITELRWRPSALYGGAFTGKLERLQINLSTTTKRPVDLNREFNQNVGEDEKVVHDGPILLTSQFVGPKKGPKEFDIVVPLATPFRFDPRVGSLLLDIRNHLAGPIQFVDGGIGGQVARVFNLGADSPMGTVGDGGSDALQVAFTGLDPIVRSSGGMIANGGFESGVPPGLRINVIAPDEVSLPGWKVERGIIDYVGVRWAAGEGDRCISIRGPGGGALSQRLSGLTLRQKYRLSFQLAMNPEARPAVSDLFVSVGSVSNRFSTGVTGERTNLDWRKESFEFEATQETLTLRMASRISASVGPVIDGVRLDPVPPQNQGGIVVRTHDLANDFSTNANPTGVWRFGWKETVRGELALVTAERTTQTENGGLISSWSPRNQLEPAIHKSLGPGVAISAGGRWVAKEGAVFLSPGRKNALEQYAVARFIVPVGGTGQYRVELFIGDAQHGALQGDADFRVVQNDVEIFGRLLAPFSTAAYTNKLALVEGDHVDFVIGNGWDEKPEGIFLGVNARLSLLSESSSLIGQ